jgi:micrococcal nuclease
LKLHHRVKSLKSKSLIIAILLIGIGIGLGLALGHGLWHSDNSNSGLYEEALVVSVIDGDTVELADGRHVRYLGIDTPEVGDYYADEAKARNKDLVEGKTIELQRGSRDQDEYGRLLRYVYVDGVFVNAELVAEGYATAYIFDADDRYSQVLVQLEQYARMKELGLWAAESE